MEKRMIKKNKDATGASLQVRRTKHTVRQSVEMTFARYDYSALEKRIRYVITYLAFQESVGRAGEETLLGRVDMDEYHQRYATIPIRILMGASRSHNYDDVRAAVDSFNTKTVWLSDGEGGWFKAYSPRGRCPPSGVSAAWRRSGHTRRRSPRPGSG